MKRKKVDGSLERQALTALITSTPFLAGAVPLLADGGLDHLSAGHVRRVAGWCVEHFAAHSVAPGKSIAVTYNAWVETGEPDDADREMVSGFLESISGEYDAAEGVNVPHLLDSLGKLLTKRKVDRLAEDLTAHSDRGDVGSALSAISSFKMVAPEMAGGWDPTLDDAAMEAAFAEPAKTLVKFDNDAGLFFNPALTAESLVGVLASDKKMKTWFCTEVVYRGLRSGQSVAMFETGDLSKNQFQQRMAIRVAAHPARQHDVDRGVYYPTKIDLVPAASGKGTEARVEHTVRHFDGPLTKELAKDAMRRFRRRFRLPEGKSRVMFSAHPNGTINVAEISATLDRWGRELGFVPTVVVIDYPDLLKPEPHATRLEHVRQVTETWRALNRLRQEKHLCLICPTQANSEAYNLPLLTRRQFSDAKAKNSEPTAFMALNQTRDEAVMGVQRWNWLHARDFAVDESRVMYVAQCIPIGAACVLSRWP